MHECAIQNRDLRVSNSASPGGGVWASRLKDKSFLFRDHGSRCEHLSPKRIRNSQMNYTNYEQGADIYNPHRRNDGYSQHHHPPSGTNGNRGESVWAEPDPEWADKCSKTYDRQTSPPLHSIKSDYNECETYFSLLTMGKYMVAPDNSMNSSMKLSIKSPSCAYPMMIPDFPRGHPGLSSVELADNNDVHPFQADEPDKPDRWFSSIPVLHDDYFFEESTVDGCVNNPKIIVNPWSELQHTETNWKNRVLFPPE